jgi:hypothetical protein
MSLNRRELLKGLAVAPIFGASIVKFEEDPFEGLIEGTISDERVLEILQDPIGNEATVDEIRRIYRDLLVVPIPAAISVLVMISERLLRSEEWTKKSNKMFKLLTSPEADRVRIRLEPHMPWPKDFR